MLLFALAGAPVASARSVAESSDRVRFGILPLGGAVDSRSDWEPLLADFGRAIGRSISLLSVGTYEALDRAIRADEVDMAFLSGKMALDAVVRRSMRVVAQVRRHDGLDGYRATLLTRRSGDFTSLQQLLAQPERWRLARGEPRSLSGFVVPQLQLFLPHRIAMETRFQSEIVGTHQRTALAVANNEADVATNNTADFGASSCSFPPRRAAAGDLGVGSGAARGDRDPARLSSRVPACGAAVPGRLRAAAGPLGRCAAPRAEVAARFRRLFAGG